jgi:hypothetical protein
MGLWPVVKAPQACEIAHLLAASRESTTLIGSGLATAFAKFVRDSFASRRQPDQASQLMREAPFEKA